jgi:predicted glycoside hydrolase/deacetylase ChbG (UPF0249 family)
MNATLPRIILCADDFGISEEVDRAILPLAAGGRLSAVSCMSLGPLWERDAPALKATGVSAGLHVTLTQMAPLTQTSLLPSEKTLFLKSWTRTLNRVATEKEVRAQFEKFIAVYGAPPAFIDGHQHVHVLPVVRDIVLSLRKEYAPAAWVRNVADLSGLTKDLNYWILAVMGGWCRATLNAQGIPFNKKMRGQFDFGHAGGGDFGEKIKQWCGEEVLIYCHPGTMKGEAEFLSSDTFRAWTGTKMVLARSP